MWGRAFSASHAWLHAWERLLKPRATRLYRRTRLYRPIRLYRRRLLQLAMRARFSRVCSGSFPASARCITASSSRELCI